MGEDRLRRLGLGRSRPAISHHHQRLAHLPRIGADPRLQSVLRVHVPRRHGLQSRVPQPAAVPRSLDQGVRRQRLRARDSPMDADARNLGRDGAVPLEGDRAPLLRLPHARPRLRQHRRPLMSSGIPYDSDHGRAICGALSAILTGRAYATSAEIAAKSGAFPGHKANAQAMLRVIRNHKRAADGEAAGYEKLSVAPTPLDHDELANAGPAWAELSEAARAAWRDALTLGEAAWLSQRAGLGRRADRHDRPRHGLRHDRHRARLRAGQIQEARRRRLFQDHQPRRARGLARARLRREADRRHRRLCGRPGDARPCAGRQSCGAEGQGPAGGGDRQGRGGARRRFRHPLRLQQMDARRRDAGASAQDPARAL